MRSTIQSIVRLLKKGGRRVGEPAGAVFRLTSRRHVERRTGAGRAVYLCGLCRHRFHPFTVAVFCPFRLPVIFAAGHSDAVVRSRALKRGAVGFIEKPFPCQVLLDHIKAAFGLVSAI